MNRIGKIISVILAVAIGLLLSSCSGYKDIRINSCQLKTMSPSTMRSADVTLAASVYNPAAKVKVEYLHADVLKYGREFGEIDVEPFVIPKSKTETEVEITAEVQLSPSMTMIEIFSMLKDFRPDGLTADVNMKIKTGGISKKLEFKDVPLEELLRTLGADGLANLMSL